MKSRACIITCSFFIGMTSMSFAAVVGSSRPEAQANFQQLIKTNACPSCDLAGVVLTRIDLSEANLENANLAGAQLLLTDLSDANLRNANLQGARLGGADLGGADLRGANLTGAVLEGAYLKGAKFDGKVVSSASSADEGLPGVVETKYIPDESHGKKAPYTQNVVVNDSRVAKKAAAGITQPAEVRPKAGTAGKVQQASSKNMAPIANAVVHSSGLPAGEKAKMSEPKPEQKGFWGRVTSFFGKKSAQPVGARGAATTATQAKTVVPMADAVVPPDASVKQQLPVEQAAREPVTPAVDMEAEVKQPAAPVVKKEAQGGLWGSITSFFKSSEDDKTGLKESQKMADDVNKIRDDSVATDRTGKDTLAKNAGVRKMIEQIEGPPPESEVTQEQKSVPVQEVSAPVREEKLAAPVATTVSEVKKEKTEQPVREPVKSVARKEKTPTQAVTEKTADQKTAGLVYDVETPAQAMMNQQKTLERLLDEERCVGCDLAGVDLSGKNLSKMDLERANLQGANLEDVDLDEANLKGALFNGANLKEADLREADLYLADFSGADLTGARLEGALVDSADFTNAKGVNLAGAVQEE